MRAVGFSALLALLISSLSIVHGCDVKYVHVPLGTLQLVLLHTANKWGTLFLCVFSDTGRHRCTIPFLVAALNFLFLLFRTYKKLVMRYCRLHLQEGTPLQNRHLHSSVRISGQCSVHIVSRSNDNYVFPSAAVISMDLWWIFHLDLNDGLKLLVMEGLVCLTPRLQFIQL